MSSYIVKAGDTFESIARKQYGSEQYAGLVNKANPGAMEPLTAGTTLVIPPRPGAPVDKQSQAAAAGANEVAIMINGTRFRFWSELRLTRSLDGMDTVEFSAPFDADSTDFREVFRPFSYATVVITVGGDILFTGTMISVTPSLTERQKTIAVSAYSFPAVLNDCTAPASAYPIEFNDVNLSVIASALAAPFGIAVSFTGKPGTAFERVAIEPGSMVLSFLSDLARQRSLVVSSTPFGELLFQQSVISGQSVAVLQQGASPVVGVQPAFSPQQYYSHITGLESVDLGTDGSQYTVKNPFLTGVVRPFVFKAPDVQGGDIKPAVRAKLSRMYGNMVAYSVQLDTWRDSGGNLWAPNTLIKLQAPGAMIYSSYMFVIRSVSFERSSDKEAAELSLALPGAFNGEAPEALPWD